MVGLDLTLLSYLSYQSLSWVVAVMSVFVVEAFLSHELAKISGICSESSYGDPHVVINLEDLFLMAGQIMR